MSNSSGEPDGMTRGLTDDKTEDETRGKTRGKTLGVGLIGCGNIASSYLRLAPLFESIEIRGCADIDAGAARARGEEFGVPALSVEALLAREDVDIALNLTIPAAHAGVSLQALNAGKHVFSEKPFVLSLEEGRELGAVAHDAGLRIGSAPDTFLGGAHQHARALVDAGVVGRITSGTAHVMNHGLEHWHPNPDFFYKPGAGPVLDIGPYYVTNLVQLLGPVSRVSAMAATPRPQRLISSAPRAGEHVDVETPTTMHALLAFESGALITLGASWDVRSHRHAPVELYGEDGSLYLSDPNFFGGDVQCADIDVAPQVVNAWPGERGSGAAAHPFGQLNQEDAKGRVANYRSAGLADMATAIREGRPHRCSFELALHVVDVMTSILASAEQGAFIDLETRCERPEPLTAAQAAAMLSTG